MEEETNGIFKFWYEKLMMRFSFALAFFAFLGVFAYAYVTEVSVRLPGNTAPFSETLAVSPTTISLAEKHSLPIEKPHRTNKELQGLINTIVSESLFFDADNYEDSLKTIKRYYTDAGFAQYKEYLETSKIISSLKNNNYRMSVFVEEQPLLLNGTAMQGVYRWLYQLPVTVSFLPRNVYNLRGSSDNMVNKKLTLRVQIRRIRLPDDPDAIQIESWTVSPRR